MSDAVDRGRLAVLLTRNPEWYEPEPAACCICGADAVPHVYDGVYIPTPNGQALLRLDKPSCLSCRVDAAENLSRRGLEQPALGAFVNGGSK